MRPLPRRRPALLALAMGGVSLVLVACGSQLNPETVNGSVQSGGGDAASVAGGVAPPTSTDQTGVAPGDSSGVVPPTSALPEGGASATGVEAGTGRPAGGTVDGAAPEADGDGGPGPAPVKAGDCAGLQNQVGITSDEIVIANSVDISGPVPGLMRASQEAVQAYAAYFNATSDLCGRKLRVLPLDSRTDGGADQVAYATACAESFAAVGSMSAFDSGGSATAERCGLPDLRAASASLERSSCSTCFGAFSLRANEFENAVPDFVQKNYPAGADRAAYLWINVGVVPANANYQIEAMEKRGINFVVERGIDISEFNYAPYVQALKDADVEYLQFLGSVQHATRMVQAMDQGGYRPELVMMSQPMYEQTYIEQTGEAAEGTHVFVTHTPFFEANTNPEIALYMQWLEAVRPGALPTSYGLFSWSAARLFVETAVGLGGKLTRESLVEAFADVRDWTANGAHAPQNVGAKRTAECWRFIKVEDGAWTAAGERRYTCSGTTVVNE